MSELDRAANPTTEEAIKYLEGMIFTQDFHPSTLRAKAVNAMAIAALREQAERSEGCSFCDEKSDEHDYMNGVQSINGTKYLVLETSEWDGYYDCFKDVRIPVTYCPMCGKRLEVEP